MRVVDEVDKVKSTHGRVSWLNKILRNRYNNFLPVVLCGNININAFCLNPEQNKGDALKDSTKEVGEVVLFDFESYRANLRKGETNEN